MLKAILLLAIFALAFAQEEHFSKRQVASVTAVDVGTARVRAVQVNTFPAGAPRILEVKAIDAQKTTSAGTIDAVHFVMSTLNQAAMYFGYFHAAGEIPTDSATDPTKVAAAAFAFALRAIGIFEYNDGDGVPGFQYSTGANHDNITGWYNLSHPALPWKPITVVSTRLTGTATGAFNYTTVTMETQDNVFMMKFIVTESPVSVNGLKITPDQIKVDFAIRWFTPSHVAASWTTGPSTTPNARVGIVGLTAAAAGVAGAVQNLPGNTDSSLRFTNGAFAGFFTWAKNSTATIQGIQAGAAVYHQIIDTSSDPTVAAAAIAGWVAKFMWFSFEAVRPSEVYWDPTFGADINYSELDNGNTGASLVPCSLIAFFALLLVRMLNH